MVQLQGTQEQTDWLAGNPIKVRVGIDENGFISIDTLRDGANLGASR